MGKAAPEVITATYADWQRHLAQAWFTRADVPVVMFADDDELTRVAPAHSQHDAATSLARAVMQRAAFSGGGAMFSGLQPDRLRWRRSSAAPPPTLPLLALTVLAATRMHRDDQGASSAYYLRLAQALLPDGTDSRIKHLKSVLPAAFQRDLAPMWRELHEWLIEGGGKFGYSTIREHPHFTLIGYPLSQALVRDSDKAVLTRFFAAIDVTGSGVPSREALMHYLRLWASRPRGLSETLRLALTEPQASKIVAPILEGLASAWDGRVITSQGRLRLDLRLVLDLDAWRAFWAVPLVDGVGPEDLTEQGMDSPVVRLSPPEHGRYFHLADAPEPTSNAVIDGVRLSGPHVCADFRAAHIVSFRDDAHVGGWSSCETIEPFTEHMLAVHPQLAETVKTALATAAEPGWRLVRQSADAPLLAGLEIFRRVRFSDEKKLERALQPLQDYVRTALRPDVTARPRLAGGLPLLRGVSAGCYLAGGEPDLYLPFGDEPRDVAVDFDGSTQKLRVSGFPLPFARIPDIQPGEHVIQADGEKLEFRVLERSPADGQTAGTATLAWDSETGSISPRIGGGGLCGAHLGPDVQWATEPLLVRRGASESWWVNSNGECSAVRLPAPSPLLREELGLTSQFAEVMPPATASWLIQRRQRGWGKPVLLRRFTPEFARLTAEHRAVLRQVFGPDGPVPSGDHVGLWEAYRRAWEKQHDR